MGSRPRGAWTHWRSWTSVDTSSHTPSAHKRVSPLVRWPYRLVPLSFLSGGVVQLPMYYCSHTVLAMKEVLGFRVCCLSLLLLTLVKSSLTVTGQLGQHWPIVATLQGAFSRPFQSQLELIPLTVGSVASVATITLQARSARTAQSCGKRKITELNAVAGSLIPMPACSCREPYSHACLKAELSLENAVAGSLIPMPACGCRESYSHARLKSDLSLDAHDKGPWLQHRSGQTQQSGQFTT